MSGRFAADGAVGGPDRGGDLSWPEVRLRCREHGVEGIVERDPAFGETAGRPEQLQVAVGVLPVQPRRQPLRIVVDARLDTPLNAKLLDGGPVLIAGAIDDPARIAALRHRGADVVILPNQGGKVDLPALLAELGRRGINEVLAESGFKLNGSLLREGCVDELILYLAPALVGDAARGLFNLPALESLADKRRLAFRDVRLVGGDLRIVARPA